MPFSLDQFKEMFPVPEECLNSGEPFECFWSYDLPVTAEEFWPYISDSSRMNREVGYEEVQYEERNGQLHGWSGEGKMLQEWIEFPFEWNYPVYIRRLRKYSKGLPAYNFIQGYIEPIESGCRVYIHNAVYSNHPVAKKLLPRYLEPFGERYGATFQKAVEAIQNNYGIETVYPPATVDISPEGQSILNDRLLKLRQSSFSNAEIEWMRSMITSGDRGDLHRIRPLSLSGPFADPERKVSIFLNGVLAGLFTMNYEVICPHCKGSRDNPGTLAQVPVRAECHICEIEFSAGEKESIEIVFRLHPSIGETRPQFFCAAEPSKKTHVRIQRMLQPGNQQFEANMSPGRYRFLLQREQLPIAAEFAKGETQVPGLNGKCRVENPFQKPALLMVEEPEHSKEALRPSLLFGMQTFRDLFPHEQLAADLQIDLGQQTIAFVDIVGSTGFYEEQGDGAAFGAVKRHFEYLFGLVRKHGGAVVKTVGDGAMFCFPSPVNALNAGLDAADAFGSKREGLHLSIRFTIHEGPCLAVNFNTGIDFFGRTVNLAAKLQDITGANQIGVTREFMDSESVQSLINERASTVQSVVLEYAKGKKVRDAYLIG